MGVRIIKASESGLSYEPIPAGEYHSQITKFDEGERQNSFTNKLEAGMNVHFTVLQAEIAGQEDTSQFNGRRIVHWVKAVIHPKSNLSALCRAVMKRDFKPEELVLINDVSDLKPFLMGKVVKLLVETRMARVSKRIYYTVKLFMQSNYKGEVPVLVEEPEVIYESSSAAKILTQPQSEEEKAIEEAKKIFAKEEPENVG